MLTYNTKYSVFSATIQEATFKRILLNMISCKPLILTLIILFEVWLNYFSVL